MVRAVWLRRIAIALLGGSALAVCGSCGVSTESGGNAPAAEQGDDAAGGTDTGDSGQTQPPSDVKPPDAKPADAEQSDAEPADVTAGKGKANRLAKESSPYLLLHAHNPVDWYPWGEEALAKAKKEGKLIFLSVGYSSCYWCHVMERESFMDDEIAKFLNEHFVCIKVDREERPDVDEIYMTAVQLMNRSGGWPLSMFLTPDAKPFFGGTYFPPRDREDGAPGFLTVISRIHDAWGKDKDKIEPIATRLSDAVKEALETQRGIGVPPNIEMLAEVQAGMAEHFDADNGGFALGATKFPSPPNLVFLLHQARHAADDATKSAALKMLTATLDKMAQGGLRDHLGGGFHRYTVDRYWRVPHFEKMLYDNAQLASVYAEAFALTGSAEYHRVVDELVAFVLREMTDSTGGFYAALDAETDAVEGKFYVWTRAEIEAALAKEEYAVFAAVYGIDREPNFEEHYVPQLAKSREEIAKDRGVSVDELEKSLAPIRAKLLAERAKRKRPLTDTKILTGWNGQMIRGLADAGRCLKNDGYLKAADAAATFVLSNLRRDGRLLRTHTAGEAKLNAYLEDYALLVDGLIALHQATGEERYLREADALTAKQIELFWDEKNGGFYFTSADHEELIAKRKDAFDGPIPAGNAVAARNLVYLARQAGKKDYLDRADKTLATLTPRLSQSAASLPTAAVAIAEFLAAKADAK
ncbi:MAG: thioredoxin domain-containing protein [Planctomycetota bacterium]|nr:MAG: thioredoxin domain-containing protein [Planctomycetota bacterium]